MPRITIREIDNTTPRLAAYQNFAVLVPGLINTDYENDFNNVADENGVYECKSAGDFEDNIGFVTCADPRINDTEDFAVPPTLRSVAAFIDSTPSGEIAIINTPEYITTQENEEDETSVFDKIKANIKAYNYNEAKAKLYRATANPNQVEGELKTQFYRFIEVTEKEALDVNSSYAVILVGEEGHDEDSDNIILHYGNQLAYELLQLGYTVYYKRFNTLEELESATDNSFWLPLEDKSLYDFRYIIPGFIQESSAGHQNTIKNVNDRIKTLAETRGDCFALIDVPYERYYDSTETRAKIIQNIQEYAETSSSKYVALIAPFVKYTNLHDVENFRVSGSNDYLRDGCVLPGAFHYLACAAKAFVTYSEWYAVAGYTRGVSDYIIQSLGYNFGELAADELQPRQGEDENHVAVNVIIKLRDRYLLWGNRTANVIDADGLIASDFLNIRQLCTTLKKQIYTTCKRFTFDANSQTLWTNWKNAIRPLLEKMKADQGIEDYKFIRLTDNARGELKCKVRIIPIEAVEAFDITIELQNSTGTTTVGIEEE